MRARFSVHLFMLIATMHVIHILCNNYNGAINYIATHNSLRWQELFGVFCSFIFVRYHLFSLCVCAQHRVENMVKLLWTLTHEYDAFQPFLFQGRMFASIFYGIVDGILANLEWKRRHTFWSHSHIRGKEIHLKRRLLSLWWACVFFVLFYFHPIYQNVFIFLEIFDTKPQWHCLFDTFPRKQCEILRGTHFNAHTWNRRLIQFQRILSLFSLYFAAAWILPFRTQWHNFICQIHDLPADCGSLQILRIHHQIASPYEMFHYSQIGLISNDEFEKFVSISS